MIFPALLPRVEEAGEFIGQGIDAGEVGAFVEIAVDAGEAEIGLMIAAAVFEGADVLDVKRGERRIVLMDAAILTSICLQHGASAETIRHALTRNSDGSAGGPLGVVLELLANET